MWGKLTERNNRTNYKSISDSHEFYIFLATSISEAVKLMFASEVFWVNWRFIAEEKNPRLRHTNVDLGACVIPAIAGASTPIWKDSKDRALCYDTQSVLLAIRGTSRC